MKSIIFGTLFVCSILANGQQLTQTIRGKLTDVDSKTPLIGATVLIAGSHPILGAVTDAEGNFRIENVPTGRVSLQLSYIGYEPAAIPNVLVNSAKEVVLNLTMQESAVKLFEVVITANENPGEALNEMALISARSISPEQTNRYAGGFNDPSRIVSNFAGVTATQDGSNDIIVRGNAPKYVQWRLEGVQITNPNHFGDQSAVGGSISALNNNMLAASDFFTGAFTPEYGDVLSGVYDVRLRTGNNEKFESVFGLGLMGTDLTFEGPLKKGSGGSFIANYRYSTVTLISDLGLLPDEVTGIPKFQDASFKMVLPTKNAGIFSIFGLGGYSGLFFENVKPSIWETPGDRGMLPHVQEDMEKNSYLINTGITHSLTLGTNSFLTTTLSYSNEGIRDNIHESNMVKMHDADGAFLYDSVIWRGVNFKGRLTKSTYQAAVTYNIKLNAKHKLQAGSNYALFDYNFRQSQFLSEPSDRQTLVDFRENISTLRNFVSWKYRISNDLTLVSGIHNMNVLYNNKSTLEPRIALRWQLDRTSSVHAGYGKHSTMESIHGYFAKVPQADGSVAEPNQNLDLLKAHHYVVGYEKRLARNMTAKMELYYQDLYNLPVENSDTSFYATINEGLDFRYVDLVNKGTGRNYGVEMTLERFFAKNYYFMINGSLYESKFTALDGIERNTRYNGNYLVNILMGKEFPNLGRKNNQILGLNAKVFFGGGQKIIPLLRDDHGNLAVDPANGQYWDYSKAYERGIEDVHLVIVSASYKWNKPRATHELFLNLDNITNTKGRLSEFYDVSAPGSIGHMKQFGFFPNLMYRVYF